MPGDRTKAEVEACLGDEADAALTEFMCQALDGEPWSTAADVEGLVGHLLMGFGAADTDEEVAALCARLASALAPAPADAAADQGDAPAPAPAQPRADGSVTKALPEAVCISGAVGPEDRADGTVAAAADDDDKDDDDDDDDTRKRSPSGAAKGGKKKPRKKTSKKARRASDREASKQRRLEEVARRERLEEADDTIVGSRGRDQQVGNSRDVVVHRLDLAVEGRDLLVGAKLRLQDGRRYGLVGLNGSGKSVLLRRLARGQIRGLPAGLRVVYAAQETAATGETALRYVVGGDAELAALNGECDSLLAAAELGDDAHDPARLQAVMDRLEAIEAHTAEERAVALLAGLEVGAAMAATPVRELSGGWRMRVSLARALFARGDVLLLDEPTNHLDLEAILFLERYLATQYRGTVVCVSHDRAFLNAVVEEVLHLTQRTLRYHPGDYDAFEAQRDARRLHKARTQDTLDRKRAHMEDTVRRLEQEARKTNDPKRLAVVASRKKKLMRMGVEKTEDGKRWKILEMGFRVGSARQNGSFARGAELKATSVAEAAEPELHFKFPPALALPEGGGALALSLDGAAFRYSPGGPDVLRNVTLNVGRRSRLALIGRNGCGKSTLLRLLTGDAAPTAGTAWRHPGARVARFTQHHQQQLDMASTPMEHLEAALPGRREDERRKLLGAFGVTGGMAVRPMATLSGGQLTRVVLATITAERPNVLVLDEPSNHLDFQSVEALIEALRAYEGAIVLVSHDRHLLSALSDETWLIEGGEARRWDGGMGAYADHVLRRKGPRAR